ncbi:MAG: hypothetical protein DRJ57_02475 [Thermoprotei archaeon]|nr:MAG: hypothetical protein DRJ57_02475 [Thermoprotei archaeon]
MGSPYPHVLGLEWLQRAAAAALLAYAAYSDFRTREVDDRIWVLLCAISAPATLLQLARLDPPALLAYVASSYTAFSLGLALSAFELMGWADFLALACIGLITPPAGRGPISSIPALSVLVNSLIASIAYPLYLLARNLAAAARGERIFEGVEAGALEKALALLTLTRIPAEEYERRKDFYSLAEKLEDGRRCLVFSLRIGGEELPAPHADKVWVSPYVPYVAMIAAGYLMYLAVGCPLEALLPR